MSLKYLGTDPNNEFIPGVPARDLTDAELANPELAAEIENAGGIAALMARGLYATDAPARRARTETTETTTPTGGA